MLEDVTCPVIGGEVDVVSPGVVVGCVVVPSHSSKAMVRRLISLSLALTSLLREATPMINPRIMIPSTTDSTSSTFSCTVLVLQ